MKIEVEQTANVRVLEVSKNKVTILLSREGQVPKEYTLTEGSDLSIEFNFNWSS